MTDRDRLVLFGCFLLSCFLLAGFMWIDEERRRGPHEIGPSRQLPRPPR